MRKHAVWTIGLDGPYNFECFDSFEEASAFAKEEREEWEAHGGFEDEILVVGELVYSHFVHCEPATYTLEPVTVDEDPASPKKKKAAKKKGKK